MTARKTKDPADPKKRKTPAKPPPALTLRDPVSKKKAELSDGQAVRSLLVSIINRLGPAEIWRTRLPSDSTERVVAQILRKADGVAPAIDKIKNAKTLVEIFDGTELAADVAKVPSAKKPVQKLIGVTGEKGFELLLEDIIEAFTDLWPDFKRHVEKGEGEESRSASIAVVFHPETNSADAHFSARASAAISSKKVTRTAKVRKGKESNQLELFKSPAP